MVGELLGLGAVFAAVGGVRALVLRKRRRARDLAARQVAVALPSDPYELERIRALSELEDQFPTGDEESRRARETMRAIEDQRKNQEIRAGALNGIQDFADRRSDLSVYVGGRPVAPFGDDAALRGRQAQFQADLANQLGGASLGGLGAWQEILGSFDQLELNQQQQAMNLQNQQLQNAGIEAMSKDQRMQMAQQSILSQLQSRNLNEPE